MKASQLDQPETDRPRRPAGVRRQALAKGQARREQILRGVVALVSRDGYHRQSLREIGRGLAIEPAHILYYFPSREDLLQEVIQLWDTEAMTLLTGEPAEKSSLDLFVAAVRRNCATPGIAHLFLSFAAEAIDPGHIAHEFFKRRSCHLRAGLSDAVRSEQQAGGIALTVDPDQTARHLIALAEGLQTQAFLCGDDNAADDLAAAIATLRSGTDGSPIRTAG